jgi:hypothetical protein
MASRRAWAILNSLFFVVACSSIPETKVAKPAVPKTEAECVALGGGWTTLGLPYPNKPKVCDLKATDAGIRCIDSKQCQGICLAPPDAVDGSIVVGKCSEYLLNFGNVLQVSNGKVEQLNVE